MINSCQSRVCAFTGFYPFSVLKPGIAFELFSFLSVRTRDPHLCSIRRTRSHLL